MSRHVNSQACVLPSELANTLVPEQQCQGPRLESVQLLLQGVVQFAEPYEFDKRSSNIMSPKSYQITLMPLQTQ